MAVTMDSPLAAEAAKAAQAELGVELAYLFDSMKVDAAVQAKISSLGYTEILVFAKVEEQHDAMREFLKKDVGLDGAVSSANRAMVAKVIACWCAANVRVRKRHEEEAEQRLGQVPRTLPKSATLELFRAFATMHHELTERDAPA
eukprot:3682209-Amphidinium_carterae.1